MATEKQRQHWMRLDKEEMDKMVDERDYESYADSLDVNEKPLSFKEWKAFDRDKHNENT